MSHYRNLKQIYYDTPQIFDQLKELDNQWIWGESGVGKTSTIFKDYPALYIKMANKWWDGYHGEETVLIDDFDPNHAVLGHHLKIWADRYPIRVELKNHAVIIRPKRIIITSQFHPNTIWPDKETQTAIARRFKIIEMIKLDEVDTIPLGSKPFLMSKKTKRHDLPYLTVKRFKTDGSGNIVKNTTIQPKVNTNLKILQTKNKELQESIFSQDFEKANVLQDELLSDAIKKPIFIEDSISSTEDSEEESLIEM